MALNAQNAATEAGTPIELIEEGTYAARLLRVVDLGVQANPFDDKKKANEIVITFELMDEYLKDENGQDDLEKPRVISGFVKLYRGADRGKNVDYLKALDPANTAGGDWGALCQRNQGCLVNIIKKEKNGKFNNEIGSISPLMKGMQLRECIADSFIFDLDTPDRETYEKLPDWMKAKISARLQGDDLEPSTYGRSESDARATQPVAQAPAPTPQPPVAGPSSESGDPAVGEEPKTEDVPW